MHMKRLRLLIAALGLLAVARPALAQQKDGPADGIYLVHVDGDGPKVKRNDTGDVLVVGERLTAGFGQATIQSDANDNSHFRVDLKGAGPFPADQPGHMALLIGGQCFMVYGFSDREADGTRSVSSTIYGEEAMRAVAKKLNVEPSLRKHPGHQLLVTWTPDQPGYHPGDPITLTVKIKNVGGQAIAFFDGGAQRGPRNNQFGFTAFLGKAIPDTGDPVNFGGIASFRVLQPGEVFSKSVRLDHWFTLTEPGVYQITGTYALELHDPNGGLARPLWNDYATGTCAVRILK
jgi:hypothetical protein